MTEIRIPIRDGWTLVYDTEDVETTNFGVTMPPGPETIDSHGIVRREPSGYMSFDLHVSFKHGKKAQWVQDDATEPDPVRGINRRLSFENLIAKAEKHLDDSLKAGAWGATYVRLRAEGCVHKWHQVGPLTGCDDAIDCTKCGLRVLDGYRPYFPKREEQEPTP